MRDISEIVVTATDLPYKDVSKSLVALKDRLAGIPHQLLVERRKQDDLQLQIDNIERDLVQLDLAASIGIDNAGKARAEQHLQDDLKKYRAKLTGIKLEQDRLRSEKCSLESLEKDLMARLTLLEQQALSKKQKILQAQELSYRESDVAGKATKALSDFLVYTSLRIGIPPNGINVGNLIAQEINRDGVLSKSAMETYQTIVARAVEVSYE